MSAERQFPGRLLTGDDQAAKVIRLALDEPVAGVNEEQAFRRLEARLAPRPARFLMPALAFSAVAASVVWFAFARQQPEAISVAPEQLAPSSQVARDAAHLEVTSAVPAPAPAPEPSSTPKSERAQPTTEPDPAACGQLARAADYEGAAACYARIAKGSSMSAELSLYEKARIEAKALGQRERALATLSEHARRFPSGSLGSEVGLTRIELLSQLGRRAEALTAIDEALAGSLGRERAADLQVLRAELLVAEGHCEQARDALAKARSAGAHPTRLESIERRCADNGGEP